MFQNANPLGRSLGLGVAAALAWLSACLPNPQSVNERRESFDRKGLVGSVILDRLPTNATAVNAVFGERIELVGVSTDPPAPKRGDNVEITFYWSVQKPVDEDYMVFVHGDAIEGQARRIHGDHFPAKGKYGTDVWKPGEVVADTFTVSIESDYGPRQLGIFTGLYKGDYRVPLTNKGSGVSDAENRSRPLVITFP
ncbi:MAG: hypothetical protein HY791_21850 [Deltaproteobacteria bacterium]|nr:hypothetical protein [Deltaproteobacteria bacterium]